MASTMLSAIATLLTSGSLKNRMNKRIEMLDKMIAKGTTIRSCVTRARSSCAGWGELEAGAGALAEVRTLHPEYVPTFLMAARSRRSSNASRCARMAPQGIAVAKAARDEHARSELQSALDALGD